MTCIRTHERRLSGLAVTIAAICAMLQVNRVEAQDKRQAAEDECIIRYTPDGDLTEVLRNEGFKFAGYDKLCRRLRAADMAVDFTNSSGVLRERSYAWVTVRLYRRSNGVLSKSAYSTTILSDIADTPRAQRILWDSVNQALDAVANNPEPYFASVAAEEIRLRSAFTIPKKAPSAK